MTRIRSFLAFIETIRPWLIALLACLMVLASEQVIEHFAQQSKLEQERQDVLYQASTLRARLEGVINANLFLIHGLAAVIESRPDIDQAGFAAIAHGLVDERHALRHIAAAPDMVITLMYPLVGNEAAIGLDYRTHPTQHEAALRARDSGKTVITGPLTLQQGGIAFIAREPVFLVPEQPGGERRFWGLVSSVIDAETLYRMAGLRAPDLGLRIAIRSTDGTGAQGPVFLGNAELFNTTSITTDITLPGGTWQMAAIPAHGWGQASINIHLIRLMGLLAALAAVIMAYRLAHGGRVLLINNARLRTLLNTIPDLIWLKDVQGKYLICNPRFERFFGAPETTIKGKTDHDFISAELAELFLAQDRIAMTAGGPIINETWVTFASDEHRELLETIRTPVYDQKGKLLGVLGIARNITERKQQEQEMKRLHATLQSLVEGSTDSIFVKDLEGRYIVGNQALAIMLDRPIEEIIGADDYALFPPEFAARFQTDDRRVIQRCATETYEEDAIVNGKTLNYLTTKGPLLIDGTVEGVFAITRDISLLKQSALAVRESEARYRTLFEYAPDGIVIADKESYYLDANTTICRMLGYTPEELIGLHASDIVSVAEYKNIDSALKQIKQKSDYRKEWQFRRKDGSTFMAEVIATLMPDGNLLGVVHDITERKQAEAALQESETRLRLFIDHAPAALAMFDNRMHYLAVSRRWQNDYRLEADNFLGRSHYEIFPEISQEWKDIHRRGLAGEVIKANEDRFLRQDGTFQWLRWEVLPWYTAENSVGGIVIFSEDITERKLAAQALRDSETRFMATFEQAAVGIAMVSPDGRWLRVNQKFCQIVGYDPMELMQKPFQDITHPDDLDTDRDYVHRMLAREIESYSIEKRYIHKNGGVVWINLTVALVWKPDDGPDYFISVIENISSRKQAEAALNESEARYRQLFEQNPAPMLVYDRDSLHLLAVNEAFVNHYGYRQADALELLLTDLYPVEEKQPIADLVASLSGLAYAGEWHHLKKDGSQIAIEYRSHDLQYEGYSARVAVITDITARKLAEQAMRESEARYRTLFEMAPFPAILSRVRDGALLYGNQRAELQYGIKREHGIDQLADSFYQDPIDRAGFVEKMRTEGRVDDLEVRMKDSAGKPFWALLSASIVEFENEPAIFAAINDITERKRAETQIHQLNAELEEKVRQRTAELEAINKELETFTYSVSHDLKAPLRGIDGYSRLLLQKHATELNEEGRLFLSNVRQGAQQMSQLIDDLLAYSRLERRTLETVVVALNDIVRLELAEKAGEIKQRGVLVSVNIPDIAVRIDRNGLTMSLRNLLDNALKFTGAVKHPCIEVSARTEADRCILWVKDNGIGFDMKFHDRIFDIFHRLQRSEEYPGTGIGLAIVRKAMERMNGRVWAESEPGKGATFYLELPL